MKRIITFLLLISIAGMVSAQRTTTFHKAFLEEDGSTNVREVEVPFSKEHLQMTAVDRFPQPEGWPKRLAANPTFKNMRGLALADINNDGKDDIIVAASNKLYAFEGNGNLLWSVEVQGNATYPPSVADVTGDGKLEVVLLTGGIPNNGHAYVVDNEGNVLPGWPYTADLNWLFCSPALADLNNDGQMEIIFGVRILNEIHVLKADGTPFSDNWPVEIDSTPAFTVSVGDINNDGELNIIAGGSSGTLYAFDIHGEDLTGFPVAAPNTGFSYQSPMLADFDDSGELSIVGATHGDAPEFYVRNNNGEYRNGWPIPVPEEYWTYSAPTIADINGDGNLEVFSSRPTGQDELPMLYGFTADGEELPDFPISKSGGLEGFISVADVDGDGQLDLIFGSNLMVEGRGFIHAYKTDGGGEIEGFPLRPEGFTFMNGANLGDVTGDGMLNIVALSYEQTFSPTDSALVNVYNLDVSIEDANIQFGTYKGSNTRSGMFDAAPFPDDAPAAATEFHVTAAEMGELEATLTWKNPSEQVDGSPLTELTEMKILRNGEEIASIDDPEIGGEETYVDDEITEDGAYTYSIFGVNEAGEGLRSFFSLYIGHDVPAAPENVMLTADLNNATVTWEAPESGLNDAYFTGENLTYTVVRMPDEHVVAEDISDLQVEDNEVEMGNYYYTVTASNHVGEGGSASSNTEMLAPEGVLMFETFDYTVGELPPGWEIDGVSHSWSVSGTNQAGGADAPELRLNYAPEADGDSWLKTYPVETEGYDKLELTLHQYLNNFGADTGETVGIDVSYDDGATWEIIWEKEIGTADIPAGENTFYFTVPEGKSTLKLGFRFQGNSYNINQWYIDDVFIGDASHIYEVNFTILEDSDEELPVAGAYVVIDDDHHIADENGQVTVHLPTGTSTTAVVGAEGYVEQEVDIAVDEDDQDILVKLMDDIITPFDLQIITEGMDEGEALFAWNGYSQDYEFRHDDGNVTGQLGSTGGTLNTVLGSAYRYDAILDEMSWYITDEGGPHNEVKIWVFGLDSEGMPDGSNILFEEIVSNEDMQWNTYQFDNPIEAPNGFFLGVSYDGFAALAIDTGTDSDWPFQFNTHFFAPDYTSEFSPIETLGDFSSNFLIRASGTNYGDLRLDMDVESQPVVHDISLSSVMMDQVIEAGSPVNNDFNRSFVGFNVYLDDLTTPVAEHISDIHYLFTDLVTGSYVAGVQSVYTTGASEIMTIDFDIEVAETFSVTFVVEDSENQPIDNAVITFDQEVYDAGEYIIEDIEPGTYDYLVTKEGYLDESGSVTVDDQDVVIEVTMIEDDVAVGDIKTADFTVYPNPARSVAYISSDEIIKELSLIDILGQTIYSASVQDNQYELHVSDFEDGLYFISVSTTTGNNIQRLLISN